MKKQTNKTRRPVTLDDLAIMVAKGFDGVKQEFDGVKQEFDGVKQWLDVLEEGQEQIKLKLDNVAYRFELVELQRRVERLETKVGIHQR